MGAARMRLADVSNIRGNLGALEAVLADIRRRDVNDVLCLGDLIGYSPDPCARIDRVMAACRAVLTGDHDRPALSPGKP
jgi:hypothetical protein